MRSAILVLLCLFALPAAAQQLQLDRTNAANATVGQLSFLGAVVVPPGPDRLGGLSAISLDKDGKTLTALSDSGRVFQGQLRWADGHLVGVSFDHGRRLLDEDGKPVRTRARYDSEALTALQGGGWLLGFERDHRIERYASWTTAPVPLAAPPGLGDLPRNEGLEALTQLEDGSIFTIAEAAGPDGAHQAWLYKEWAWQGMTYQSTPGLKPVDLVLLPGGDAAVLERGFNLFHGFRTRIARIARHDMIPGAALAAATLAQLENPLLTENFEGMAVLNDPDRGVVTFLIVSDNNFNAAQQTILAAFELNSRHLTQP